MLICPPLDGSMMRLCINKRLTMSYKSFLCVCFYIKTGNDSCSYEQTEREHKQGPPRRHLSFFQNKNIYMCMFDMLTNLTF